MPNFIQIFVSTSLIMALCGCQSLKTADYFGEEELGDNWSADASVSYYKKFREGPLRSAESKPGKSIYRFLVLQASDPVHVIKVEVDENRSAKLTMQKTKVGYSRIGRYEVADGFSKKVSVQKSEEFLDVISEQNFWLQDQATVYDYCGEISTNPTMIVVEGLSDQKHVVWLDYGCMMRKSTSEIALAFYEIAGLDTGSDWTMYPYFKGHAEVDWNYTD